MATLESQLAALSGQALALQIQIQEIEAEIRRLISQIQANPEQEGQLLLAANALANQRVALRDQLAAVNAKITALQEVQPPAPPLTAPVVGQTETPAVPTVDENTNPETRPFTQTQSTPAQTENNNGTTFGTITGADADLAYDLGATPTGSPGVGANDDNPQASATTTPNVSTSGSDAAITDMGTIVITADRPVTSVGIQPKPNILDQYASYTWSVSMYLLTPQQYGQFMTSKKKNLTGYNLLIQSGGAPVNKTGFVGNLQTDVYTENNGVTTTATVDAGRSPAFPLDFYIDNITLTTLLNGKGTGQAHGASTLKFTVTEPNGITLIDRLYQAVQDSSPQQANGPIDYQQAQYLMVFRWYGFDENGNPVKPSSESAAMSTDPRAIVEKFIPFTIKTIKFTVSSKAVTYDFDCAPVGQLVAGTSRNGTVTSDVELTGKTVKDVLVGNLAASVLRTAPGAQQADVRRVDNAIENNTAPAVASGAPAVGSTTAVGLMQAMNSWQEELVKTGQRQYADTYEVVFAPGAEAIQNAEILLKDPTTNQSATPMSASASKFPDNLLTEKQAVAYNGRNISITAGTQLLWAIDYIIRNSKYIANQASVAGSEDDESYQPQNRAGNRPVQWYNISMEVIPDGSKYDTKVNSPVYKIRYIINAYTVQNFVSRFFPDVPYLGVHKSYPYWFTGQNTAVLDYQASFNRMYQLVVSGSTPGNNDQNNILKQRSSSMTDQIKWYSAPRSSQSTSGAENRGNEIPAEAAEYLYDPGSLAEAKVRIIGDPAWIQQGSITGSASIDSYAPAFLADGTINFDGGQPMFEISWQKPQDYDINTGLADPYGSRARNPVQSFIYTGKRVVSEFKGGKFEQLLEGNLYPFPNPSGTNTAQAATARNAAVATDPRRIDLPTDGINTKTGRPIGVPAGVNNDNGAKQAPEDSGATSPGGSYDGDNSSVTPADVATSQAPPEAPISDGAEVSWYDYEPPPKLAGGGNNADPPQTMALET